MFTRISNFMTSAVLTIMLAVSPVFSAESIRHILIPELGFDIVCLEELDLEGWHVLDFHNQYTIHVKSETWTNSSAWQGNPLDCRIEINSSPCYYELRSDHLVDFDVPSRISHRFTKWITIGDYKYPQTVGPAAIQAAVADLLEVCRDDLKRQEENILIDMVAGRLPFVPLFDAKYNPQLCQEFVAKALSYTSAKLRFSTPDHKSVDHQIAFVFGDIYFEGQKISKW